MPKGVYVRTPQAPPTGEELSFRFWSKVDQPERGCWEWRGLLDVNGYGRFAVSDSVQYKAHRFAWTCFHGPIPSGKVICHRCDNRKCCNPAHLFIGTQADNLQDASRKGRLPNQRKTVCKHGHEFTPENTRYRVSRGGRVCVTCARNTNAARRRSAPAVPRTTP